MYATRFSDGPRFRPTSLAVALAINGGVVAALLLAAPQVVEIVKREPMIVKSIPLDPPPLPEPKPQPTARTAARASERPVAPKPIVDTNQPGQIEVVPQPQSSAFPDPLPSGDTTVTVEPRFVTASVDPRYAGDFQPDYPDSEREAGNVGIVRLRILIGTDGRVKQVERVAGGAAFYRAASRHALARWRFRPATRGDIPEESWRTMTVRFTLT
ncbi:MAG: TonB family protein [Pseudomonadota bacterium]